MKIILEKEKCIGCGTCVALCDKFFELQETKARLKQGKPAGESEELEVEEPGCALEAAEICPVQCIKIS